MEDEKTLKYVEIIDEVRQMTPLNLDVALHKQKKNTLISIVHIYEELLEISCSNTDDSVKVSFDMFDSRVYENFKQALPDLRKYVASYNITEYSRETTSAMIADKYRMIETDIKDVATIEVKKDSKKGQPYFRINLKGVKGIFYSGYNARLLRMYGVSKMRKAMEL